MIPVQIIVMALIGLLCLVAGIIIFVWRWKYETRFDHLSPEDRKTAEALHKAFGNDLKWGSPGATESEMHEHGSHSSEHNHESLHSDSSDSADGSH